MLKVGRVNYDIEVWCKYCGEKRVKANCRFIPKFGYQCPQCKRRCRTKATYVINRELHPYVSTTTKTYMKKEIMLIAKEKARMV